jgi:hypothetical protein
MITKVVILMSFLMTMVSGGRRMGALSISGREGRTYYSDLEVETLIEELSEIAEEAIEKAAGEAAKAAALASLEREAAAMAEAQKWNREYMRVNADRVKNAVAAGLIGFVSGAALSGAVLIALGGR